MYVTPVCASSLSATCRFRIKNGIGLVAMKFSRDGTKRRSSDSRTRAQNYTRDLAQLIGTFLLRASSLAIREDFLHVCMKTICQFFVHSHVRTLPAVKIGCYKTKTRSRRGSQAPEISTLHGLQMSRIACVSDINPFKILCAHSLTADLRIYTQEISRTPRCRFARAQDPPDISCSTK